MRNVCMLLPVRTHVSRARARARVAVCVVGFVRVVGVAAATCALYSLVYKRSLRGYCARLRGVLPLCRNLPFYLFFAAVRLFCRLRVQFYARYFYRLRYLLRAFGAVLSPVARLFHAFACRYAAARAARHTVISVCVTLVFVVDSLLPVYGVPTINACLAYAG